MCNKLFKYIRRLFRIFIYIDADKLTDLPSILNYIIMDDYKKSIKILVRSAETDKAQALYLFRRLDTNLVKSNGFRLIYYLIVPQTALYSPLV